MKNYSPSKDAAPGSEAASLSRLRAVEHLLSEAFQPLAAPAALTAERLMRLAPG